VDLCLCINIFYVEDFVVAVCMKSSISFGAKAVFITERNWCDWWGTVQLLFFEGCNES
jgi:hypothetical protein